MQSIAHKQKMNEHAITLTLPNSIYERIGMTAKAASITSEEVIKQSIILLLPAFESDMPLNLRLSLASLTLLNDIELWKVANSVMNEARQIHLEELTELRKERVLTEAEQSEFDELIDEAQEIMLCKAEARRVLAQRGHIVFRLAV